MDKIIGTYKNFNDWHRFRLRLLAEGLLVGLFSGCVVGFFRYALFLVEERRSEIFAWLKTGGPQALGMWLGVLLLVAYVLHRLIRYEPLSGGSGIPQVKGNILGIYKTTWWRIIFAKLVGGILGIGAGMSLGREGPSIQLGAMCGQGVSRLLGRVRMEERYLITGGAGAGLAAAFNAPLAGVIFTLEELHKNFSSVVLLPTMAAALVGTYISRLFFGRELIFRIPRYMQPLPFQYFGYLVLLGVVMGFLGAFFNRCLLRSSDFYQLKIFKNNFCRILLPLLCSIPLGFYLPQVLGGGNALVDELVREALPLQLLLILLAGKFVYTMLSYGTGVPGGFFLPMLVLGALGGSIAASLMVSAGLIETIYRINIIVFAMAGFFAASVRAPITGIVLIMEMTGSFYHLLGVSVVALFANVVADVLHSRPIYESLLERSVEAVRRSNSGAYVPDRTRTVLEMAVASGSTVDGKFIKDIEWPEHTLLVDVKRGENELIPDGETRLLAGDYIYVLVENSRQEEVRRLVG